MSASSCGRRGHIGFGTASHDMRSLLPPGRRRRHIKGYYVILEKIFSRFADIFPKTPNIPNPLCPMKK